jgi:tetratricopeptide (TPR) repeat protein
LAAAFLIWKLMPSKPPHPGADAVNLAIITFANQTGDPSYDYLQDAIPNLLITSLEQSESIRVMPWERIFDLLKRLGKSNVRLIDADLGFELCRMDGVDMIILGSYIKAGNMFATDIKIHDVQTRRLIKSSSARGEGVDSILKKQIDDLSNEITRWLVEAEKTPSIKATPISEVTTTSMDAYGHFLKGREAFERVYLPEARADLERAVEIDPGFSLAYFYLARVHSYLGNNQEVTESLEKFKKHHRKIPGKEGLYLEALKARYVDADPDKYFTIMQQVVADYPNEKRAHCDLAEYFDSQGKTLEAIAEYEKALQIDPEFGYALNLLAYAHLNRRDFDKAIEFFQDYIALYPDEANPHDSMAEAYFFWGKYDQAVEKYKDALKIKPDFGAEFRIGYCYAVQENYAEALRWTDQYISAAPSNTDKARGYLLKGYYDHLLGRVGEAFREWDVSEALLRSVQDEYDINMVKRGRLWTYYDWGLFDEFWKAAQDRMSYRIEHKLDSEALNRSYLKYYEGVFDLNLNRTAAAAERLAEVKSAISQAANQRETELMRQAYFHLSSEILLSQGKAEEAISEFQKGPRPQLSFININTLTSANFPLRDDFTARALVSKGNLEAAIAEYERILLPANTGGHLVHPLARYRLAGLYEKKGLTAKAVEQYRKLAEIWKDADPDLAVIRDARGRLDALQTR